MELEEPKPGALVVLSSQGPADLELRDIEG